MRVQQKTRIKLFPVVWLTALCGTYWFLSSSTFITFFICPQNMAQPPQHPAFLSTFPLAMGFPLSLNIGFFFSSDGTSFSFFSPPFSYSPSFFSLPFSYSPSFFDYWLPTSNLICSRSTTSDSGFALLLAGMVFAYCRFCSSTQSGLPIGTLWPSSKLYRFNYYCI